MKNKNFNVDRNHKKSSTTSFSSSQHFKEPEKIFRFRNFQKNFTQFVNYFLTSNDRYLSITDILNKRKIHEQIFLVQKIPFLPPKKVRKFFRMLKILIKSTGIFFHQLFIIRNVYVR